MKKVVFGIFVSFVALAIVGFPTHANRGADFNDFYEALNLADLHIDNFSLDALEALQDELSSFLESERDRQSDTTPEDIKNVGKLVSLSFQLHGLLRDSADLIERDKLPDYFFIEQAKERLAELKSLYEDDLSDALKVRLETYTSLDLGQLEDIEERFEEYDKLESVFKETEALITLVREELSFEDAAEDAATQLEVDRVRFYRKTANCAGVPSQHHEDRVVGTCTVYGAIAESFKHAPTWLDAIFGVDVYENEAEERFFAYRLLSKRD